MTRSSVDFSLIFQTSALKQSKILIYNRRPLTPAIYQKVWSASSVIIIVRLLHNLFQIFNTPRMIFNFGFVHLNE